MKLIVKKTSSGTIYQCACCGEEYAELPLCFGSDFPDYCYSVPENEIEKRIELTESLCVVDQTHFFHRGTLTIPIHGHDQGLVFNAWASINEENFWKRNDNWTNPLRVSEAPYFGWLNTRILGYEETINIKVNAVENEVGVIPHIVVLEEGHPLTADQAQGISMDRALELVGFILKTSHQSES